MKHITTAFLFSLLVLLPFSCKDPEPEPTETEIINEWIWDVMTDVYLWADDVDRNLYPTEETDPEAFFYNILHADDRFSWIVDDYEELINSFNNISLSSGISPYFVRINNTDEVIIIVEYVTPGSPADLGQIQRGEIITRINQTTITIENYINLFYGETLALEFADYTEGDLVANGKSVTINAVVLEENPVLHHEIITFEEKQIGYIVFTGFSEGEQSKWVDSLDHVFADLQNRGISELIMDIRYNPGGRVSVARHIASVVSPADVPGSDNVFVKYQWNEDYQQYFIQRDGENSENLVVLFEESPSHNLNLSDIYFLTSGHSASASELIIIGLEPYMNVIQIGENTYGKFYGSITVPDLEEPARHSWGLQPLVFKFASSTGFTDFNNGLIPDIIIDDNILDMKQFGDLSDPILARAVEEITGVAPEAKKSLQVFPDFTVLSDPVRELKIRSVADINKAEMVK
ncbi:MAG: S41 family peptidase [Bacteroidales bacterium]